MDKTETYSKSPAMEPTTVQVIRWINELPPEERCRILAEFVSSMQKH